jgi:hypothetical protein
VKGCTTQDKVRNADVRKELRVFSVNGRIRRRQVWLEHLKKMEEGHVLRQDLWYRLRERRDPDRPCGRWNVKKPEQAIILIVELEVKEKERILSLFEFEY